MCLVPEDETLEESHQEIKLPEGRFLCVTLPVGLCH